MGVIFIKRQLKKSWEECAIDKVALELQVGIWFGNPVEKKCLSGLRTWTIILGRKTFFEIIGNLHLPFSKHQTPRIRSASFKSGNSFQMTENEL